MGRQSTSDASIEPIRELIRGVWSYRLLVIVAVVASFGSGLAVIGRTTLIIPMIDKVFVEEDESAISGGALDSVAPAGTGALVDRLRPGVDADPGEPGEAAGEPVFVRPTDPIGVQVRGLFKRGVQIEDGDRWHFLFLVIALALVLSIIGASSTYLGLTVGRLVQLRVLNDIRVQVYRHLMGLSLKFYHRQKTGDLLSRLTNDLLLTQRILNFLVVELLQHPVRILWAIVLAFMISWQLSLTILVVMPVLVWPLLRLGRRVFKAAKKRQVEQADLTQAMMQTFSGIRVIQAFRMEDRESERFEEVSGRFVDRSMKVERAKALARSLTELIYSAGVPILILVGGWMVLNKKWVTPGEFIALFALVGSSYPSIKSLSKVFNQLLECLAGTTRVFQLLDEKAEVTDAPGARDMPPLSRSISFDGVTFSYDSEPVLRDVDFEVPIGKVVAIVGPSGAGKSTMLDLIARFYDPVQGAVRFDGVDIREFRRESILENLAVVTQEAFLFNTTVRENIRFGRPDATDAEVEEAARAAQIHDHVMSKLPDGYDTVVGERGELLSGGQRQRITIARAVLRNPPLLLLDEATSALDTASENLVQEALSTLLEGRTTFAIAHRLSTVQDADWILVMSEGRVVEEGTHDELLERGGVYSHLYEIQFADNVGRRA